MKKLLTSTALLALMSTGYAYGATQTAEPQTTAEANMMMLERLTVSAQMETVDTPIKVSASEQTMPADRMENDSMEGDNLWDTMAAFEWTDTSDQRSTSERDTAVKVSDEMYQPGLVGDDSMSQDVADTQTDALAFETDPNGIDTMIQLLEIFGYDEKLTGDQAYTVFAPTNAAFRNVSEEQLNRFIAGYDADKLAKILEAHIVEGEFSAADISQEAETVKTAGETQLTVREDALGQVRVGNAFVIASDDSAENGVIHVVDKIISLES